MARYKGRSAHPQAATQSRLWIGILCAVCLLVVSIVAFSSWYTSSTTATSRTAPTSASSTQRLANPDTWTQNTPVQIYNRRNGQWETKTYGDVLPDTEFMVENVIYATTPNHGLLFAKPELNITKLAETDRAFDPNNWRMPQPEDIVFLVKTSTDQQQGHWLLRDIKPGSHIVFQGREWTWNLDATQQHFVLKDTGNVLARVTATHVNVHDGDVLALRVKFETCGKIGIITGSEEHPFYVLDVHNFVHMVDLKPNMRLKTDDGSQATVIELQPLDESMKLYNLTVEHVQNYYIYTSEDDPGVLVHNTGPCNNWTFGGFKSPQTWENQMTQRGWTKEQITEALQSGESFSAVNNINPGNSATRYVHPTTGRSVVIDDFTHEIIHIGGDGFLSEP